MFNPLVQRRLWATLLAFLVLSPSARADIIISDLEFRAGIGARPGVIFGRLSSEGEEPDRLLAVESPNARIELHTHEMRENIMRMRRVEAFSLSPGTDLVLESGGHHLMVFDFENQEHKTPLRLVFRFENAPAVTIELAQRTDQKFRHHKHR